MVVFSGVAGDAVEFKGVCEPKAETARCGGIGEVVVGETLLVAMNV